ncbi:hypothetical protein HK405_000870, partial [Cladochytrium tenue]
MDDCSDGDDAYVASDSGASMGADPFHWNVAKRIYLTSLSGEKTSLYSICEGQKT